VSAVLEEMLSAAVEASRLIMEVYAGDFAVDYKSPSDPVTQADRLANEAICRHLARAFPGIPVVAEESDPSSFESYQSSDRILFVDPLDGTREFIAKNGEFVVMIGLVDGDRATHGVVLAPNRDTAWVGEVGAGASRIDRGGVRHAISPTRARSMVGARVVTSRAHRTPVLERLLHAAQVKAIVPLGSAGLKSMSVAQGDADAYAALGSAGKRWDVCAPEALVHAAGGCFSDARGKPFDYRDTDLTNLQGIAVANTALHGELVRLLSTPEHEDHSLGKPTAGS